MAQAARLSLRMQKELKLFLSDPPHGVSFPHLSTGDLSTIDAQIQGPEETVYANGIFVVKIQIPERYPFQPPIVAFVTPIYHPNIDNSGRICLDILNLPPKGAWQPSLNISTVLMSIRLLLTEPNPDDGLMCQVSKEYKYNRQSFDFKAREMTDKYAKVKADGSSTSLQIQRTPSGCEVKSHGDGSGNSVLAGNHEKLKLTVESSLSIAHSENRDTALKDILNHQLLLSNTGDGNGKRKAVTGFCDANTSANEGIIMSRKKLSLGLPPQSEKKDLRGEELTNEVSAACKEIKKQSGKKLSLGLKQPLDNATSFTRNLPLSFQTSAARSDNNRLSRKLPLKPLEESLLNEVSKTKVLAQTNMEPEMNQKDARSWCREFENPGLEEASMPRSIVVQDSDESGEDEKENHICRSSRSRLSLTRRCLKRRP